MSSVKIENDISQISVAFHWEYCIPGFLFGRLLNSFENSIMTIFLKYFFYICGLEHTIGIFSIHYRFL
jgi:hypothetical protein